MTTTYDGPAEIKIKTESENGESSKPPNVQPVEQEEEPHLTHSFEWCGSNKRPTTITCNTAGTVEDVLKRSSQFRQDVEKHKHKEMVIMRDGKAISSHFPCSLIEDDSRLIVKYVKAVDKVKKGVCGSASSRKKEPSSKLVTFHVSARGGKNVVQILKNSALKKEIQELTVYGYKGETVTQALKRDGRFLSLIFRKNCALSQISTEVNMEMSNLVDDLEGKSFQIILLNKGPPESQPGSLDDAYISPSDSEGYDPDESQNSTQQATATDSENSNLPEKKPTLSGVTEPENVWREIPCSEDMQRHLSSKFKDSTKGMKTQVPKLSRIQNLLRVEFGKNAETCREVKMMKRLMELGDSVCQVRINGRAVGSGFLLFDKFVLTNAHVIKNVYDDTKRQLNETVTVHFSFEDLEQTQGGREGQVEEVVGFEYDDVSPCDWALLRLSSTENLPRGLLTQVGFIHESGAICIIGHPDGGVKKIDPCLIVPTENRNQVVQRHCSENQGHIQFVTPQFFENVAETLEQKRQVLLYNCCFFGGSSGSPVFDNDCNVIAVHSAGYLYPGLSGQNSVIEYGYPLSDILEHMIIQMVERGRFDVLKDFLACNFARRKQILINVKKLVESRNLTAFKNMVSESVNINDESLKMVFELFSHVEEPVSMEIN